MVANLLAQECQATVSLGVADLTEWVVVLKAAGMLVPDKLFRRAVLTVVVTQGADNLSAAEEVDYASVLASVSAAADRIAAGGGPARALPAAGSAAFRAAFGDVLKEMRQSQDLARQAGQTAATAATQRFKRSLGEAFSEPASRESAVEEDEFRFGLRRRASFC